MKTTIILISVIFTLAALFLIGDSITGLVFSQSCCFGESCPTEYLCEGPKDSQNEVVNVNLGVFFLIGSVSLCKLAHKDKK